jgi:polynucleotide 5'-hydroxyl-kinase GRC3/NOL9
MTVITDNQFDALKPISQTSKKFYNEFVLDAENQIGIVSMPVGGRISFFGQIHLVPIQGSFSMYGSNISKPWMRYPAYAPQNQGLVLTCTKGSSSATGYDLDQHIRQVLESLLKQTKNKKDALIGLVGCTQNGLIGIQSVLDTTRHILENKSSSDVFHIDGFYHVENNSSSLMKFPVMWEDCLNTIRKDLNVLCILGARNSGKSTFARYSMNKLLSVYERIAFLECDPGQSEFTAPGMVSLNIVSKPCIGRFIYNSINRPTIYSLAETD